MSELTDERLREMREYYFENTHFLLERDVVAAIDELLRSRQESQNARDTARLNFIAEEWFFQDHKGSIGFCFNETWDAGKHKDLREAIDAAMSPSVPDTKKGDEK